MIHQQVRESKQKMTREQKSKKLTKLTDAFNAGFITTAEYVKHSEEIHRAYYIATHGEFNLSDTTTV
jgi:hypothetical protein